MLLELSVKHLAVIEEVRVSFQNGFHVITGETGAGKSILIDALSLAIGGRASADLIRHGYDKAEIEALFDIPAEHPVIALLHEQGVELSEQELLVIRREVSAMGKSSARVNGQLISLSALKAIGELLVNIHGQHEHQSLLRTERHLEWLDAYGHHNIFAKKQTYQTLYHDYAEVTQQLDTLRQEGQRIQQMAELYRFQWDEIEAAKLQPGEEVWLNDEKQKLSNAERLFAAVNESYEALYGNKKGLDEVARALQRMVDIQKYDQATLGPIVDQMQSAYYQLEDATFQLRDYREAIEFNPDKLEQLEQRLQLIHNFKRKYGESIPDILAYAAKIRKELDELDVQEERITELTEQQAALLSQLNVAAEELSVARRQVASQLAAALMEHLADLHMDKTRFEVELQTRPGHWAAEGIDQAEFMIAPNPGEPLRPLAKIASGGEMSRIMLALKSIFAVVDRIPVLIFDEVDTGVSGRAAQAIAEKMARLAQHAQVFAITHLPQVACMADAHYAIEKKVHEGRTFTEVTHLNLVARKFELARMLGGVEVTETTLHHAQEMLVLAESRKVGWR
jgi:DNA repair protein RecN (Recombination protein N)